MWTDLINAELNGSKQPQERGLLLIEVYKIQLHDRHSIEVSRIRMLFIVFIDV